MGFFFFLFSFFFSSLLFTSLLFAFFFTWFIIGPGLFFIYFDLIYASHLLLTRGFWRYFFFLHFVLFLKRSYFGEFLKIGSVSIEYIHYSFCGILRTANGT